MDEVTNGHLPTVDRTALRAALPWALLIAAVAFAGLVVLGDRTPMAVAMALGASVAAGLVVVLVPSRPLAAFGVLILLASLSKETVDLSVGRVRLDQPAVLAAMLALALTRRWPRWAEVRPVAVIVGAFAAYLAVLTLSSVLYAPHLATSVRMLIWTAISMSGGAVAFTLLLRLPTGGEGWFTANGVLHAVVGLTIAIAFLMAGPDGIPGMQVNPGEPPKVAGLAWEANLYASLLGAMAPFALEHFRARRRFLSAVPGALIIGAMGLGVTRGAYMGLAAGLGVYLLVLVARSSAARSSAARASLARVVVLIAVAAVLAPVSAALLLPAERPSAFAAWYSSWVNPAHPTCSTSPSPTCSTSPSLTCSTSPSPTPSPSPSPTPSPTPPADTLEFRLNRVPTALSDLAQSPIIGLGAATFGQRHEIPGQPGKADYLAILGLVAVYESGILGALALGGGLLLVLLMLLRAGKHSPGPAAAYAGSLVSLLVAYEATNALFFSFNWLIIGAALAFAVRTLYADRGESEPTADDHVRLPRLGVGRPSADPSRGGRLGVNRSDMSRCTEPTRQHGVRPMSYSISAGSRQRSIPRGFRAVAAVLGTSLLVAAACGGSTATSSPLPAVSPSASATATGSPTEAPSPTETPDGSAPLPSGMAYSDLDGMPAAVDLAHRLPIAIMIDDNKVARPQSGMSSASIVYQAPADGGEDRYMVIFQEGTSTDIGPVRSARPYFVYWAAEYKASFGHYGGDAESLQQVLPAMSGAIYNMDALRGQPCPYHRITTRNSPHNAYTNSAAQISCAAKYGFPATYQGQPRRTFVEDTPASERPASQMIDIPYRTGTVGYEFDPATDSYKRLVDGHDQIDPANNEQVYARNIVVMFQAVSNDYSEPGHVRPVVANVGSGNAIVFKEGRAIVGTWKKTSNTSLTRFYDAADKEIPLVRGEIFLQSVPIGTKVTYN